MHLTPYPCWVTLGPVSHDQDYPPLNAVKPLLQLTSYYLVVVLIVAAVVLTLPAAQSYLPVGGSAELDLGTSEFITGQPTKMNWEPVTKALELALGLVGIFVFMAPVAWVYMGARRRRGREQSFVLTLLLLPLAVAGIVIIVENSLALAFSLAGIVAGVRFRLTLDDTLDAVFIFMSIGIGLAGGIGALEVAAVLSLFFNFALLLMWRFQYAEETSETRWFSRTWMNQGSAPGSNTAGQNDGEKSQSFTDNISADRP